ncbi:MAG: hypothetical protein K2X39_03765, partial [Silvanigrellaceae bacterium]|nr:hypothetical protein [Silvanigrellaceae bacterium]
FAGESMIWMDSWVLNTPSSYWPKYMSMERKQSFAMLFRFFETKRRVVVLSSSNNPSIELNLSACKEENIPILRRKGGGGTVVLGKGCVVLTFAFYAKDLFGNKKYFSLINALWIEALGALGVKNLSQQGISDICYQQKKIAGTSIFRKKHLLVYQGSLLVCPEMNGIERLLAHPSREPDYRHGRSHSEFLTSLFSLGYAFQPEEVAQFCQDYFLKNVGKYFDQEVLNI